LYAKRRLDKGFAFAPDSYLQHELESSFIYEDTPDQLKATQEVKADMENERPMDRLVCGDVGFGKTEVAIRAAFKAVDNSKQVAVLVPTTILAYQHYRTFKERLKGMPVTVNYINRFRTAKQKAEILKDLESGKLDILIGTHQLVSKNVIFKNLGLLVVDEEQKFGVIVKDKLKTIATKCETMSFKSPPAADTPAHSPARRRRRPRGPSRSRHPCSVPGARRRASPATPATWRPARRPGEMRLRPRRDASCGSARAPAARPRGRAWLRHDRAVPAPHQRSDQRHR